MLARTARLIYNVHGLFVEMARLIRNCNRDQEMRNREMFDFEPRFGFPALQEEDLFIESCTNLVETEEKKNTNFQNAYLHLMRVLQGMEFRRAGGKFFQRVVTPSGLDTNAFE